MKERLTNTKVESFLFGNKKLGLSLLLFVVIIILDFIVMPLTDSSARSGRGYKHHSLTMGATDPDYYELRGYHRVIFNFKHFFHWWIAWPENCGLSPVKLLGSDGNSALQNFFGHFVLGTILTLLFIWFIPQPVTIFILGSLVNIFHEYIGEGQYVDPSFIDLWLGQLAILSGIICYYCLILIFYRQNYKKNKKKGA